jgi:hypothetical protein
MKKNVLGLLLRKVILGHDPISLLHSLEIYLRIPLITDGPTEGVLRGLFKTPTQPSSRQGDQLSPIGNYSTVRVFSPTELIPPLKNMYYLSMVIEVTSPNLWMSPYSSHQTELYHIIKTQHEDEGWDFQRISNWLNDHNHLTPRGKTFTQGHAWSMYTKKKRSIQRFSRENELKIKSSGIDVVNYKMR